MKKIYLVLTMALVCVMSNANAQLYAYLDDPTGAYAGIAANVTATNLSRYNGLLEDPACGSGFSSNKHTTAGYTNGRPGVQFTITPNTGFEVTVTSISVDVRRNPKGPALWRIAYSTDGGTSWTNNGTDLGVASSGCFTYTSISWDVEDFTTANTVIVRLIGHTAYSSLNGVSTLKNVDVTGTVQFTDADGDGFTSDADCNDADASINPGATEICNGIDENCNGFIDEGAGDTWYADADGDTYGDAATTTIACDVPAGFVANSSDCNDADASVNPAAIEVCNGVDDNCDGNIDEGIDLSIAINPTGEITLCKPDEVTLEATAGFDSYQWYKNGSPLTGATGATYTTNKPAYYQVEGIIGTCSSGLSAVQAVAVVESPNANIFTPDGDNLCVVNPALIKTSFGELYTYVWFKDGVEIPGATTFQYEATEVGAYYCVITNEFNCTRTTASINIINVCREGVMQADIEVYPNPVKDALTIALSGAEGSDAFITIMDVTGRIVYTNTQALVNGTATATFTLDSNISNGVYVVSAVVNGTMVNRQFVVAR